MIHQGNVFIVRVQKVVDQVPKPSKPLNSQLFENALLVLYSFELWSIMMQAEALVQLVKSLLKVVVEPVLSEILQGLDVQNSMIALQCEIV